MADTGAPIEITADDPLAAGRDAVAHHAWREGFTLLTAADKALPLTATDLELLATAAFFAGDARAGVEAKERAYRSYLAGGDTVRAAYMAVDIAREHGYAGRPSMAAAWLRRAERQLDGLPESYAHGFLQLLRSEAAAATGNLETALSLAEQAVATGDRFSDPDLKAFSRSNLGFLKITRGDTDEGFALMEEAAIAAVNDELSPFASGATCCQVIAACRDLTDYQRASEWIEATEAYCKRQDMTGFPGVCRLHRAEVKAVRGAWDTAEQELIRATDELEDYGARPVQADGYYAIGEIRRLRGDLAGAEAALREAHARGRSPQPALAMVRLAEGEPRAALKLLSTALEEAPWDRWSKTRLLPARVEAAVAANEVPLARESVDELAEIIVAYPSPALEATRQVALGRVLLAEGDATSAATALRAALRGWREVGSPYEVARTRAVLAAALRALDDRDDADLELRAALDEFRRLGATVDATAAEREQRLAEERRLGPAQVRMTFMFTDIVGSTSIAEALGDVAWDRALRWHDDRLRELIAIGGGETVNTTGDGFFVAFDDPRRAVECAIAIQRRLRDHRDETGFALPVRIGLHVADANRHGRDYSGVGVHVAARVGALAGSGEILATVEVLEAAGRETEGVREASVKGVSTPVRVATVSWG